MHIFVNNKRVMYVIICQCDVFSSGTILPNTLYSECVLEHNDVFVTILSFVVNFDAHAYSVRVTNYLCSGVLQCITGTVFSTLFNQVLRTPLLRFIGSCGF